MLGFVPHRDARLDGKRLDRNIDGLSGVTLSHRAAKKVSRLALILHRESMKKGGTP